MAALLEGQQYGLSAQDKINSNKTLVFVKLTDSALRSIEEFVKKKGNAVSRPTIQFQNSNGVIRLPQNGSCQSYGFTLSNVEADGPKGSFECLRQTGNRCLESLGCMHMKMHIHATEDSYEKTRVKMAAAEQEHKKFCTKEIKPSGAHLGRKVKVKRPGLIVSPIKSNSPPTSSMLPKNPVKIQSNGTTVSNNSNPPLPKKPEPQKFPRTNSTPKSKFANSPELLRQPIRDRIIHILAIRPYKRPELLVRLMSEGIRDKDKKGITAMLSQCGTLKGNVYTLANYLWNEVQDNWKFCTQEEAEIIRKRKQQFLNSNENGSTSPNAVPSTSPAQKRVSSELSSSIQEPRSKKQRISHYTRPENPKNESPEYSASDKSRTPPTTKEENGRTTPIHSSGLSQGTIPEKSFQKGQNGGSYPKSYVNSSSGKPQSQPPLSHPRSADLCNEPKAHVSPDSNTYFQDKESKKDTRAKTVSNGYVNGDSINKHNHNKKSPYTKVTSTTNGSCSTSPHSSSDSRDSMDCNGSVLQASSPTTEISSEFDCPSYLKEYRTIDSSEQRRRYKQDFDSEYTEYLRLHNKIEETSRTFAKLEHILHSTEEGSEQFKNVILNIYKVYRSYQEDPSYVNSLKKFNFLHSKLSHIKRLVMEYDGTQCVQS
ncbi:RNA polymerase II elongation factor ELL2-like [Uloborus diversus]|uniref:RNA polymerase II elongation factor ELL2-like n=1 Tax=Uloborus diversus TaxID=327109 RepID=UPI002409DF2E|nr:RNA polymerase II elongation factor ELL2-like [Uloborus diversus]